ncbi:MAG: hypothetical protein NTV34_18815 [Proteobacteria bacterium]|nr:hypothetical protein [Pseudomonadota bacterium]
MSTIHRVFVRLFVGATFLLCTRTFAADVFKYAGTYRFPEGGTVSFSDDRRVELSSGALTYTRRLVAQDDVSYSATGYFSSGNCHVPVESFFDFSSDGMTLDVEFHKPQTILTGPFGGCSFLGNIVTRATASKASSSPSSDWARQLVGKGCGQVGARDDLARQMNGLRQTCLAQGGASSSTQSQMPSCSQPDPNDLSCSWGYCTVRGRYSCDVP